MKIAYYVLTGLFSLAIAGSAFADLSHAPAVMEGVKHLGYPDYLATILGVWKALGLVAILAPRFPRLKEWAYAGLFFDLSGAFVSHLSSGDPLSVAIIPLVLAVLGLGSWYTRPADRKLTA